MTSSVAFSNYTNLALLDVNNPRPGTSNYVVPHRFSLRASLGKEFFEGHETRFTLFAYHQEGQPGSFVMDSDELEGGSRNGRHRLYVPTGPSDPNVVFADSFPVQAFFDWVGRVGLGPGFAPRNSTQALWSTRVDIGVHQDFPIFGKLGGRFYLRMYNLLNFIDDDWGKVYDANFSPQEVVGIDVNAAGQYVFQSFDERDITDLLEQRSLWTTRFGVELRF